MSEIDDTIIEVVIAYRCDDCEAVLEDHGGSLYECGSCGTIFNQETSADGASHRCPDCNKMSAKIEDYSCAECNEARAEEVQAVWIDEELVVVEGEGTPEEMVEAAKARIAAEEAEEQARFEFKQRQEAEEREKFLALQVVKASEVRPGDKLQYHDSHSHWNKYPTFDVGRVEPDWKHSHKVRILPPGGMGFILVCEPEDTFGLVSRPDKTPENEPSLEQKLKGVNMSIRRPEKDNG